MPISQDDLARYISLEETGLMTRIQLKLALKQLAEEFQDRKHVLMQEAKAAEMRASHHDYYGRKTPEYFEEMRLAAKLRELANKE